MYVETLEKINRVQIEYFTKYVEAYEGFVGRKAGKLRAHRNPKVEWERPARASNVTSYRELTGRQRSNMAHLAIPELNNFHAIHCDDRSSWDFANLSFIKTLNVQFYFSIAFFNCSIKTSYYRFPSRLTSTFEYRALIRDRRIVRLLQGCSDTSFYIAFSMWNYFRALSSYFELGRECDESVA